MEHREYQLIKIVQKIPLFLGLSPEQMLTILKACRPRTFERGEQIYQMHAPGDNMLILLEGKLVATDGAGERLGEIHPISTAGELGAFTGNPRSANVVAVEQSKVLIIHEKMLSNLLTKDPDMHLTILDNLVALLADRLHTANDLISTQSDTIRKLRATSSEMRAA